MKKSLFYSAAFLTISLFSVASHAEDYVITVKDNKFSPQELVIPADQKVKITVKNLDSTPVEFESKDLKREKVVKANNEIVISVGPLKAGSYGYVDEFHEDTTKGTIVVK